MRGACDVGSRHKENLNENVKYTIMSGKIDLTESGKDQRVIYAMISNFQSRIDILTTVLEQIEDVKQLKTNTNQTSI